MLSRFLISGILLAQAFAVAAQNDTDTPKLWKVEKRYNRQTLYWRFNEIPFIISAQPLMYPLVEQNNENHDLPKGIQTKNMSSFYFYGNYISLIAFSPSDPLKSRMVKKGEKTFNYFKANNIYFKIYNSKAEEVSDQSFTGILATPTILKRMYEEQSYVLHTSLKVNEFLLVNFYDKKNNTLLKTYYLKRIQALPLLKEAGLKTSATSAQKAITIPSTAQFTLQPNQQLVLTFDKNKFQEDSVIQYQLLDTKLSDTSWHKIDQVLTIANLKSKTNYKLNLRYTFQKESTITYQIQTQAHWFETARFILILGAITLLLLALLIWRIAKLQVKRSQQKQKKLQHEIHTIQNQLNPHFTFNALSSIQGLINTNKIEDANYYLSEFSNLLRTTLSNSHHILIPLNKEVLLLEAYLKLEQLRFSFKYNIVIDTAINQSEVDVPNFLLQPLIENAIKHGVSALNTNGNILIHFEKINSDLSITITDNGSGFDEHMTKEGHGIHFVKEKIKLLNRLTKQQAIQLSFTKVQGTVARIYFNNWLS